MTELPLPIGTRVTHLNQQWANSRTAPDGTAKILEARGPYSDSSWEYRVLACRDFSRRPGPGNRMDRETWWSSNATRAIKSQA